MIVFEHATFQYDAASEPVLRDVNLTIPEGDLVLAVGRTGSGKSTLLQLINGLAPHFTGGRLSGSVRVDGLDTRTHPPRDLAGTVSTVIQNPAAGFVADTVEEELAYTMESLGVAPDVMRRRVEETLDLLGLVELRSRSLTTLSGGQQQRVAIGAALTSHPRVLILDEPTSALDPAAAEEVLAAIQRLVHDLGLTVLMAEHRLERVVEYADQIVTVGDGRVQMSDPVTAMQHAPVAPAVVRLAHALNWTPLPLSVRQARRFAAPMRAGGFSGPAAPLPTADTVATLAKVDVRYRTTHALRNVTLPLRRGEITALMGRNGAGKSTLMRVLSGMQEPDSGKVDVDGADPAQLRGPELLDAVAYVPQDPTDLFYSHEAGLECAQSDSHLHLPPGTTADLFLTLVPNAQLSRHPRDLSSGQQLALALALMLTADPGLVLLDEPTRGLDYPAKDTFVGLLRRLAAAGRSVVMATHDVELVAAAADRVVVLADGEVITDGPTRAVLSSSPAFAPQVQKIFAPLPVLTVSEALRL